MKNALIIIIIATISTITYAQAEIPLTFECIETPFHVDNLYETDQMNCENGMLTIVDDHPCNDIYHEDGFIFYTARFKHELDTSPIGKFGDIYFHEDGEGEKYVEMLEARMSVKMPTNQVVSSMVVEIEDLSQNGFVFSYNDPITLTFYPSFEALEEALPNVHWNGYQLFIDEVVSEFQIGADHIIAKKVTANQVVATTNTREKAKQKVYAYPNPVNDILSFDLGDEQLTSLQIFDIQGQKVLQEKLIVNSKILVASLTPGIYLVRATTQNGNTYVQKITKL